MKNKRIVERLILLGLTMGVSAVGGAQAPTDANVATVPVEPPVDDVASAEDPGPQSHNALVQEITVTAQKREENLQDVPLSVQAFSADQLSVRGAFETADLPRITPGLISTAQFGFVSTYIRGVGTDAFILADPSVATYIDGVYNPSPTGTLQDFGVIERIEVLKGPQGTIFGRNAVGGAIHVITKPLSLDAPEAVVQSVYGSDNNFRNKIAVSIPLTGSLAIGLSGIRNSSDPYLDGTIGGEKLPDTEEKGYRAKVRWKPTDRTELNLSSYYVTNEGPGAFFPNAEPSELARLAFIQPQSRRHGALNEGGFTSASSRFYTGQFTAETSWFDMKLIGSDQHTKSFNSLDFDGSPAMIAFFAVDPYISKNKTAELQMLSNAESWGNEWLHWILGAYYFDGRQGYQGGRLSILETQLGDAATLLGIPLPDALVDLLPAPTGEVGFQGLLDTNSRSAFTQVTADVTEWFSITLGGRYQNEKRELVISNAYLINEGGNIPVPGQDYSCAEDSQWCVRTKGFYPKISFEFRPADDVMLYVSRQRAVKSGTINAVNLIDAPDVVKPEKLTAYEAGIKSRIFDGLVTFNAAAFQYDTKNTQTQFVSLFAGGVITFENADKARSRGFEFDMTTLVAPDLVDDLVLSLGGTYLDAKYRKFPNASGFTGPLGTFSRNNDFSGNRIVRSPKFTGTAGLFKTFAVDFGSFDLGVDYYYNNGFYYLAQNAGSQKEDPYGVLGARASFRYAPWNLQIAVFGRNITDTDYNSSRFVEDLGTLDSAAQLANYGVQLNWEF